MKKHFRNILLKLGDNPTWSYYLQRAANLGDFTPQVKKVLEPKGNEKILDFGCGLGVFSKVTRGFYVGVDINNGYIKFAQKHFSNRGKKHFIIGDIKSIEFPYKYFDKSLYIAMMHHFNDEDNRLILNKLSMFTKGKIIILDYAPYIDHSWTEKFFLYLERSNNVRRLSENLKIINDFFEVEDVALIKQRSQVSAHSLITCMPRK